MGHPKILEPHHIEAIVTAGLVKNAGKVSAEAIAGHYAFLPAPPSAKPETVPSRAGDRLGYSGKRFEFLARQLVAVMKDGDPMFGTVPLAY